MSEVIGVLLNDTELMDIFTGCSVVAGLLLSDICAPEKEKMSCV